MSNEPTPRMRPFAAVAVIESDEADYDAYVEAFQALIDDGIVWQLQGWYGRAAAALIEAGECVEAE